MWRQHGRRMGDRRSGIVAQVSVDTIAGVVPSGGNDVRGQLAEREEGDILARAIDSLPQELRETILLHFAEGLSKSEIAERLEVHPATIGRRLARALELLRSELEPMLRSSAGSFRAQGAAVKKGVGLIVAVAAMSAQQKSALAGILGSSGAQHAFNLTNFVSAGWAGSSLAVKTSAAVAVAAIVAAGGWFSSRSVTSSAPALPERTEIIAVPRATSAARMQAVAARRPSHPATPTVTRRSPAPAGGVASVAAPDNQTSTMYDWNAPRWRPPREDWFPMDAAGAEKLKALWERPDKDRQPPAEVFAIVRNGLRAYRDSHEEIVRWVGGKWVWNARPQNPEALEIMYHATTLSRHYAIYFGLSVADERTTNISRALAESLMSTPEPDWNDYTRIKHFWRQESTKLVPHLQPFLRLPDKDKRDWADGLIRYFRDDFDVVKWAGARRLARAKELYADDLPAIRERLMTGNSKVRMTTMRELRSSGPLMSLMNEEDVKYFAAMADDPDNGVRREAARMAGGHWIWSAENQNMEAIRLMLRFATDTDHEVRYNAVYHGLSTVREPNANVCNMLIDLAIADQQVTDRAIWGLKNKAASKRQILEERLKSHVPGDIQSDPQTAAKIGLVYKALFESDPPVEWGLQKVLAEYNQEAYATTVAVREGAPVTNEAELMAEFQKLTGLENVQRVKDNSGRDQQPQVTVVVRGPDGKAAIDRLQETSSTLLVGNIRKLTPNEQLYMERLVGK